VRKKIFSAGVRATAVQLLNYRCPFHGVMWQSNRLDVSKEVLELELRSCSTDYLCEGVRTSRQNDKVVVSSPLILGIGAATVG